MSKAYQGYRADTDTWEQFESDDNEIVTPETTGYDKVEPIDENSIAEGLADDLPKLDNDDEVDL